MIRSTTTDHIGNVVLVSEFRPPYRFDKGTCTEPMVGIVHAFAVTAAIACRWPYSLVPSNVGDEAMAESYAPRFRYSD